MNSNKYQARLSAGSLHGNLAESRKSGACQNDELKWSVVVEQHGTKFARKGACASLSSFCFFHESRRIFLVSGCGSGCRQAQRGEGGDHKPPMKLEGREEVLTPSSTTGWFRKYTNLLLETTRENHVRRSPVVKLLIMVSFR